MEKSLIERIIEKLEEIDTHGWEFKKTYPESALTTRTNGFVFFIEPHTESGFILDKTYYFIRVEDEENNMCMTYPKEHEKNKGQEKIKQFYEKIYKSLTSYKEKELSEKFCSLLLVSGIKNLDLEKITQMLEKVNLDEWKISSYFNDKYNYPGFTVNFNGLKFYIIKCRDILNHYRLEIEDIERDAKICYHGKIIQNYKQKRLISRLYGKLYKNLKEGKEEKFQKKLDEFLTE